MSSSLESPQEPVELIVEAPIAQVAFNRPQVLNAINTATHRRLIEVFEQIDDDPGIRCVVLKGHGRSFCVGADQQERPGMSLADIRERRRISPRAFAAMRRCTRPVIAQVHGYALGSGLEMAMGCDLMVSARGTVLGLIETQRGAIPAGGGTQLLPRLVGEMRARELIYTGRRFLAEEALAWGLGSYVVPAEELEGKVMSLASEIAAAAPVSVTQAKEAMNLALEMGLSAGFRAETALFERTITTSDRLEAIASYREKRPPAFRGE
jgi:enoyl-CoA hydratase/carnithine racemase